MWLWADALSHSMPAQLTSSKMNCFVNSSICSPWAAECCVLPSWDCWTQLSVKISFERQHLKTPFCGQNFGTVKFYMISESIAVGSVNGNSLWKKQGGRERKKRAITVAERLQSGIIKSPVSCLNKYMENSRKMAFSLINFFFLFVYLFFLSLQEIISVNMPLFAKT